MRLIRYNSYLAQLPARAWATIHKMLLFSLVYWFGSWFRCPAFVTLSKRRREVGADVVQFAFDCLRGKRTAFPKKIESGTESALKVFGRSDLLDTPRNLDAVFLDRGLGEIHSR